MNALAEVVDFLRNKIRKINPNNPKANTGGAIMKSRTDWEDDLEDTVSVVFSIIQFQFTRTSSDSPAGVAQLTATSTMIGQKISERLSREPLPWSIKIRLGDLFVEAFKVCGFIDLYYPKIKDSSYVITATHKWTELAEIPEATVRISIIGTTIEKPAKITGSNQTMPGRTIPLIKGYFGKIDLTVPWIKAIDNLQSVGWRINNRILKAMLANEDYFITHDPIEDNDAKEQKRRSKIVEWSFITRKAEHFKGADVFYQYFEADYRGRLYNSEPFLNFQGSDYARGLLQFAKAKPMTEEGLQWLAIHTASSFNMSYQIEEIPSWCAEDYKSYLESEGLDNISVDKMTLEDRIQWTNEFMEGILEAGRDHSFSDLAEKPVSFLACCLEWFDYQQAARDNRIHFTRLPIPIDGSNNGWQHLGAISKDTNTGELVGLVPIEIQKDFYVQTAKELINQTTDERLSGILASMPMKHIRKAISKRGSMTRAYSAGAAKIGENMWFDCKSEDYHEKYGITEKDCMKFAKILIKAIDVVCPGPLETMGYLQNLAAFEIGTHIVVGPGTNKDFRDKKKRRFELLTQMDKTDEDLDELNDLTKELELYSYELSYGKGNHSITWDTPSGFEVIYNKWVMTDVKQRGSIDGKQIKHVAKIATDRPDIRGFMCGISPNFIHSMDAAHMALVIADWNGDFGAVHDSFSTHASDVDMLLAKTKQVFIEMYDHDNFFDTIREKITNNEDDVEQPALGSLNIRRIEDSDYFFA